MWAALSLILLAVAAVPSHQEEPAQVVELALFIEKSVVDRFQENEGIKEGGKEKLMPEINYFLTEISKHLQTIQGQNITLGLRHLVWLDRDIEAKVRGRNICSLKNIKFSSYLNKEKYNYDVALLFTGAKYPYPTAGCANPGKACTKFAYGNIYFTAIYRDVMAAAHEIGHILGAYTHNTGVMNPVCSSTKKTDRWFFSKQSSTEVGDYLNRRAKKGYHCLTETHPDTKFPNQVATAAHKHPDRICQRHQGKSAFYSRQMNGVGDAMCVGFYCQNGVQTYGLTWFEASDGMTCGKGKACHRGKCIADPNAPTDVDVHCLYGDQSGVPIRYSGFIPCSKAVEQAFQCERNDRKRQCCATCRKKEIGPNGCVDEASVTFGSGTQTCKEALTKTSCYNPAARKHCCASCRAMELEGPNCWYTDSKAIQNKDKEIVTCQEEKKKGKLECRNQWIRQMCCVTCNVKVPYM